METLYETRYGTRDDFPWEGQHGALGCTFKVGSTNVMITHLGYYDKDEDGLVYDHNVGLWSADSSTLLASVLVTNGVDMVLSNSYRWVALEVPYLLRANTFYVLGAEVWRDSADPYADGATRTNWNAMYVGTNGPSTRDCRYGGTPWPAGPENGSGFTWGANTTYGAPNMATWAVGPAKAGMADPTATCAVGQTAIIQGIANGAAPLTIEWYKAPGTLLPGKTNAILQIPNATLADSGEYYLVAKNGLATNQSPSCTLTVSAVPVFITTHPTNTTVYNNYSATFYVAASGTPPITYQWRRNGSPIEGATQTSYTIARANMTNHGEVFSCVASNNTPGPQTATSSGATLTVLWNIGEPAKFMHETIDGNRNTYSGTVGGKFTTGNGDALVSHLGFYDRDNNGLTINHNVGIFNEDGSILLGSVDVPAGTGAYLANGYRWVTLDPPLVLSNRTTYILAAEVTSGDGDAWPDAIVPANWDSFFVNGSSVILAYGGPWPNAPLSSWGGGGMIYGAPNMALLPAGAPAVMANPLSTAQYETLDASFDAIASGQPPVTGQWYKAPSTSLVGQTNGTMTLTNLVAADAGEYFLMATGPAGSGQSRNVTLTVLTNLLPEILQEPQSVSAYVYQTVSFSVIVTGLPPFSYEWKYNGSTIPNATNRTLVLTDITVAKSAGNYQVVITNPVGSTNSAIATLTVLTPDSGTYPAGIVEAKPLIYYRFSDVNAGSNAFNLGTLGAANTGTYEGTYSGVDGPLAAVIPRFESTNLAVALDGVSADVSIPALNLDSYAGTHCTIAAWVNLNGAQAEYSGIVYRRASGGYGLAVKNDTNGIPNQLMYTWLGDPAGNNYWPYNSGLIVPQNQWAFVALVIEPTVATLYLGDGTNLVSAQNIGPHTAAGFAGVTYVGWDSQMGGAARRLYGAVDEVMIFGRALSPAEINLVRLGLPPTPLSIVPSGGKVILTWPEGTLQQSDQVESGYTDMVGVSSPYTNTPSAEKKFFRVRFN